jgi:Arc/MetJ family transcription regulator
MSGDIAQSMPAEVAQDRKRQPLGMRGFERIENRGELRLDAKDERGHQEVVADAASDEARRHSALQGLAGKRDAAFLFEFAQCGVQQVGIAGVAASAGQRPLPRPGIVLALGPPDQEDRIRVDRMQERDGCFGFRHYFNYSGISVCSAMRLNIEIDDELMRETLRATGLRNKREAVELGLRTLLRLTRQAKIREFRGKLHWEGDLGAMRTDR